MYIYLSWKAEAVNSGGGHAAVLSELSLYCMSPQDGKDINDFSGTHWAAYIMN